MELEKCRFILMLTAAFLRPSLGQVTLTPGGEITFPLNASSSVEFDCTANGLGILIVWRLNNVSSTDSSVIGRGVTTTQTSEITRGVYRSTLRIPSDSANDNTTIVCVAINTSSDPIGRTESSSTLFRVQGLLGPPLNIAISETSDGLRALSWDAPETLDITNVDPDIDSYQVCYNLTDGPMCVNVIKREFSFPNVAVSLLLTVYAFNMVGKGNPSSAEHKACEVHPRRDIACNFSIAFNQAGRIMAWLSLLQRVNTSSQLCLHNIVYDVVTFALSQSSATHHMQQRPKVSTESITANSTILVAELFDLVDANLEKDRLYVVRISSSGHHRDHFTTKKLIGTYDLQAVTFIRQADIIIGLKCIFAPGSQSQGCRVTVCREDGSCLNFSNNGSTVTNLSELQPGQYSVVTVAQVVSDDQETVLELDALELSDRRFLIPRLPPCTCPPDHVWPAVGFVTGIVVAGIITILVVLLYILLKMKTDQGGGHLL